MGTNLQFGSVDVHQHLERNKRLHYSLFDLTRAMIAYSPLDMERWLYIVEYAAYTRKATKLNALGMRSYEAWYGRRAEIQLGVPCIAIIPKTDREGKIKHRATTRFFTPTLNHQEEINLDHNQEQLVSLTDWFMWKTESHYVKKNF